MSAVGRTAERALPAGELGRLVEVLRPHFVTIGLFSGVYNVLALTGALFMLTVYDRVIPSGSLPTLAVLSALALVFYAMQAFFDILRGRMLVRAGLVAREALSLRAYDIAVRHAAKRDGRPSTVVRDLDQIQGFLGSMGPIALLDLVWLPIFVGVCFLFHFWIGMTVVLGALVLVAVTLVNNALTRTDTLRMNEIINERDEYLTRSQGHSETIRALGMTPAMSRRWDALSDEIGELRRGVSDVASGLSSLSRTLRMVLQSMVLAVGALLVIRQEATGGIIIAGSILAARALAPVELAIGQWKGMVAARESWARLRRTMHAFPDEERQFALPRPSESLACENVGITIPGTATFLVRGVSFRIRAGQGLGIIGPTGSGKSTLVRAIVGLTEPTMGTVRLDGEEIRRWNPTERGAMVGYLPQAVALFDGTLAQNIARFSPDPDPRAVVLAARRAGVHGLIARLPEGYDTRVNAYGEGLSGGQIQRIGLARALFGDPLLLVLDEPNSNLDEEGEKALRIAMGDAMERGAMVIIVTHRPSALEGMDQVLVLRNGQVQAYGTRDDVIGQFSKAGQRARVAKTQEVIEPSKAR